MRILWISPITPSRTSLSVQSANMVTFELIAGMLKEKSFEIGFLKMDIEGSEESFSMSELGALGVNILSPLRISNIPKKKINAAEKIFCLFLPMKEHFYPILKYRNQAKARVAEWGADAIIIPWSEVATALFADCDVKVKYAYYGNPDPKPAIARLEFMRRFNQGNNIIHLPAYVYRRIRAKNFERVHLDIMSKYDVVGDVALNDTIYYRNAGIINSYYRRNVWHDRYGESVFQLKNAKELRENLIIGNVGKLNATANTLGLEIIGKEIVPHLQKKLGRRNFAMHIMGARQPAEYIQNLLNRHEEIRMRGFVEDIDTEIQKAKVFLVANNASSYKVGHTRYLHAWSLGTCIVAHVDASLSMPEIINRHNALLGRDSEEIADLIVQALGDDELRRRIAFNGYRTFKELFTAQAVIPDIIDDIKNIYQRELYSSNR